MPATWVIKLEDMVLSAEWTSCAVTVSIERIVDEAVTKRIMRSFTVTPDQLGSCASEDELLSLITDEAMRLAQFSRNAKHVEGQWKGKVIGSI